MGSVLGVSKRRGHLWRGRRGGESRQGERGGSQCQVDAGTWAGEWGDTHTHGAGRRDNHLSYPPICFVWTLLFFGKFWVKLCSSVFFLFFLSSEPSVDFSEPHQPVITSESMPGDILHQRNAHALSLWSCQNSSLMTFSFFFFFFFDLLQSKKSFWTSRKSSFLLWKMNLWFPSHLTWWRHCSLTSLGSRRRSAFCHPPNLPPTTPRSWPTRFWKASTRPFGQAFPSWTLIQHATWGFEILSRCCLELTVCPFLLADCWRSGWIHNQGV